MNCSLYTKKIYLFCFKGNKRFRDIVSLHRPDYVRASKNNKPNVAALIVKAIRNTDPPGRFLKKNDDGKWYDVGDKKAREKCSQALREKPINEKSILKNLTPAPAPLYTQQEYVDVNGPSKDTPRNVLHSLTPNISGQLNIPTMKDAKPTPCICPKMEDENKSNEEGKGDNYENDTLMKVINGSTESGIDSNADNNAEPTGKRKSNYVASNSKKQKDDDVNGKAKVFFV